MTKEEKKEYMKKYRIDNKERISQKVKEYQKKHCEKIKEYRAKYVMPDKNKKAKIEGGREYYKKNKEKASEYGKHRYLADKEKYKKQVKDWSAKNRKKSNSYKRKYAENNKERVALSKLKWEIKNPGAKKIRCANRRSKISKLEGKLSPGLAVRLLSLQKNRCAVCRGSLRRAYHLDHVIPLALGGKNTNSNIQLTCPKCNLSKGSKDPIQFMRERGFLL
jgi:5-methylcytosine-specific restriction endonuclease McrA